MAVDMYEVANGQFTHFEPKYYSSLDTVYEVKGVSALAKHGSAYGYFELDTSNKQWRFSHGIVWREPNAFYWDRTASRILWRFTLDKDSGYKTIVRIRYDNLYEFPERSSDYQALHIDLDYRSKHSRWAFKMTSPRASDRKKHIFIAHVDPLRDIFTKDNSEIFKVNYEFKSQAPAMQIDNIDIEEIYISTTNSLTDKILSFITFTSLHPVEKILSILAGVSLVKEPDDMCITCLSNKKQYAFLCGHLTYCEECYVKIVKREECPLCRAQSKPIKIIV